MPSSRLPTLEVVIPLFNEVGSIVPLLRRLDAVKASLAERVELKVLFVNDGSTDGSTPLLYRIHKERTDVRVVDLVRNFGQNAALAAGVDHAAADAVVFMDGDLQDPPESIPALFEAWRQGARTVVVTRGDRPERLAFAFRAFYALRARLAPRLPKIAYGTHCLVDRVVVERMKRFPEQSRYFPGLVAFASGRIHAIAGEREPRAHGRSRAGTAGLLALACTALFDFSDAPMRVLSTLSFAGSLLCAAAGFGAVAFALGPDAPLPLWLVPASFLSSFQLLALGVLGEYVARNYSESKGRPLYLMERVWEKRASEPKAAPARA